MSAENLSKIKLDLSLRSQFARPEGASVVEPSFLKDGVPYYDELPLPPENLPIPQVVISMSEVGDLVKAYVEDFNSREPDPTKQKQIGFDTSGDKSWKKDPVGSFTHAAVLNVGPEGNVTGYAYDIVIFRDGPINKVTGLPKPSSVVAPIEKVVTPSGATEHYVRCYWEYRPVVLDEKKYVAVANLDSVHDIEMALASVRGEWELSVPGKYASAAESVPTSVSADARSTALLKGGLAIGAPIMEKKTLNRSNQETKTRLGFAEFKPIDGQPEQYKDNKMYGSMGVNIKVFESDDGISELAVHVAVRKMGLIR